MRQSYHVTVQQHKGFFFFFFYLDYETIGTAATPGLLCQPRMIMKMIVESMMECRFLYLFRYWVLAPCGSEQCFRRLGGTVPPSSVVLYILVTIDGVRIGNWIYWTITERNYK
jgi:hypothetical protein